MARWNFRRSTASARLMVDFAAERGWSAQQMLRGSGISEPMLASAQAEIEAAQELHVVRNLVALSGNEPALGLLVGARYRLTTYGIWGYTLLSSRTLGSAVDVALRYLNLTYAFVNITLRLTETAGELLLDDSEVPADVRAFLFERDGAAMLALGRELLGSADILRFMQLRVTQPREPQAAERYQAVFGSEPHYGAGENVAAFPRAVFDMPLPLANEHAAQHSEAMCRALLEARQVRTGLAATVRDQLLRQPGCMPDMEAVAAALCMTTRTLRRRLDDEGVSFRGLVDEVRATLAIEMLRQPQLTLDDIAERLGYAEAASFILAFKRWKGVPPSAVRRELGLSARKVRTARSVSRRSTFV
jgi:AraC-like DNA-binding protein